MNNLELWIAQHDTVLRIDLRRGVVADAKRVRTELTGSFVASLAFDATGSRLAVSHSLRLPQPIRVPDGKDVPWYAPSGGQVLVIDADRFEVTDVAAHPTWLPDITWLDDTEIIGIEWGGDNPLAIVRPVPARHDLHPPRPPGTIVWI